MYSFREKVGRFHDLFFNGVIGLLVVAGIIGVMMLVRGDLSQPSVNGADSTVNLIKYMGVWPGKATIIQAPEWINDDFGVVLVDHQYGNKKSGTVSRKCGVLVARSDDPKVGDELQISHFEVYGNSELAKYRTLIYGQRPGTGK